VDGVVAFGYHGGCAMQFAGQQHQILNRVMGGFARHPNVGGYLLVGLGCEQVTLDYLMQDQQLVQIESPAESATNSVILSIQDSGGTARTVEEGIAGVARLLPRVNDVQRESIPAGELVVATQCGGSDGSSGITANPALGLASDRIVACGGTVILGETTEIAGAEQLLTRRAVSAAVGRKLLERIRWWRGYAELFGEQLDDNRSAGNEAGGLTTIAEKSLGAIAKGGNTALTDVYQYAEPITKNGLVVMDSPGFDPCSLTGMVASGANLIVFTTGRGSCYGCKPVPSIKVASNTPMYERLRDDMDINAGCILEGTSLDMVGEQIFQRMLAVASGEKTKSEHHGIGDEEYAPWMIGPIL
jgi:altronate dehydratase